MFVFNFYYYIGIAYKDNEDYQSSLKYFNESLRILKHIESQEKKRPEKDFNF